MPRYNFLDEAGLKKYHQLAGYSTIPIAAVTNYTFGKLNTDTGGVLTGSTYDLYYTSDFIELPVDVKYTVSSSAKIPNVQPGIICYYDRDNEFISYDNFVDSISFTLKYKIKNRYLESV